MKQIKKIFKLAKDKGLRNVSIVIFDSENELRDDGANDNEIDDYTLVVGKKDRFVGHATLDSLEQSIEEEKDLAWINE